MDSAAVFIEYPQLSLTQTTENDIQTASLIVTGHRVKAFNQKLSNNYYFNSLLTSDVFGEDYATLFGTYFGSLTRSGNPIALSGVSINFSVKYSSDSHKSDSLETLYFFKLLKAPPKREVVKVVRDGELLHQPDVLQPADASDHTAAASTVRPEFTNLPVSQPVEIFPSLLLTHGPIPPGRIPDGAKAVVDANIYLVNKQVYMTFLNQLFPNGLSPENESVLLYLINGLVDLTDASPALSQDSEGVKRKALQDTLAKFGFTDTTGSIYDYLTKNFSKLFDLPIKMPKFKLLTVAGTLSFRNSPTTVLFDDFVFYHLSAEYSVSGGGDMPPAFHVSRYEWDKAGYQNNKINFTYTEKAIQSSVQNPVRIRVKAYDQSDLYSEDFDPSNATLQMLNIIIDLRLPPGLEGTVSISEGNTNQKIRGKIVALSKTCTLKGTVVIQAKATANGPWVTVATGISDKAGNFTTPYPYGKYVSAQALVSLDPTNSTPIQTDPQSAKTSISQDFLYILLQDNQAGTGSTDKNAADCNCNSQNTADRLPSQDELIQSNQFTQDVGGTCLNLTVPNRTLREYSYTALIRNSDPDVATYTLSSFEDGQFIETYDLTPNGKVKRDLVDLDNPVKWQDGTDVRTDLTISQAVTVATGVILHYRSEFRADGYSLGDLLYSLPLAPGQKKQVVIIDASHSLVGTENQSISQSDSLANSLINERSIVDQIAGNIGESLQGQSNSSTSGISAGLGAAGSAGFLGASLGVSGGYSNANSSASQDSKRGVSQYFSEFLRQSITQNASDYRHLSASAVTTVQEGQTYNAETDVVANHNHCHSLTMMYFEVLRHFAVYQELVDAEECVFVPLLMTKFTTENVGKWADILVTRLLPMPANTWLKPATYVKGRLQHPLIPAFDALERYRTNWTLVDYPNVAYDQEPIREIEGTVDLKVELPRPKTKYDFIFSFPIITVTTQVQTVDFQSAKNAMRDAALSGGLSFLFGDDGTTTKDVQTQQRAKIMDNFITIDDNFQSVPPAQCIRVTKFDQFSVDGKSYDPMQAMAVSPTDSKMWEAYAKLLNFQTGATSPAQQLMVYYFQGQLISEWNGIFNDSIAPAVYKAFIQQLVIDAGAVQVTTLDNYKGGVRYMTGYVNGQGSKKRADISFVKISSTSQTVLGLQQTPVTFDILRMRLTYSTDHFNGLLYSGNINADLLDPNIAAQFAPERGEEKRNPRKDDIYLANRLLQHLNSRLEYYNRALWYSLDSNRRYMLLDGFQIETYDKYGQSEGFRSLASILKNDLISIVGNSLVFPAAPGYKVSQALVVRKDDEGGDNTQALLDHYRPDVPAPPYRISVPTRGVFMEAVMGSCDACEKIQPDSSQDWSKFTTDEPTAVATVAPPVPTVTPYQANFKDFAPPIVQIQNSPAAPDPGTALAGLTTLLGQPGIFKDVTGLDQTQKNAIQALTTTQENAKAFAQMASALVTQSHNTTNSGQIMDTIKNAQADGNLNKQDASKLVKDHIQSSIDGGATVKSNLDNQKEASKPSLAGAAVNAAGQPGTTVKASRTDSGDGSTSESVEIQPSSSAAPHSDYATVIGTIEPIKQKSDNVCWAAAATMMVNWIQKESLTIEAVMRLAGDVYLQKYQADQGLLASEKQDFLDTLAMVSEPPASYTPQKYIDLMKNYGPLWVTVDSSTEDSLFSPHAEVLIKITSDDTSSGTGTTFTFLDPKTGGETSQSFQEFLKGYEQAVTDNRSMTLELQIVHFSANVNQAEGFKIQGPWNIGNPVHETMTLAALMASNFNLTKTSVLGQDQAINEFIRGVIWNDDPATLLFDERKNDNWNFSSGLLWWFNYSISSMSEGNITKRSHKGDLQFFHAMGSTKGEAPDDTLAKIKLWAEIMYKLAIGQGFHGSDKLSSVPIVTSSNSASYNLSFVISPFSNTSQTKTLNYLLTRNTEYTKVDISRRALGSLLHMIQDSYARGHCKRTLLNPGDLKQGTSTFEFQPGKHGSWGAVENFHTYVGQPSSHGTFDDFSEKKMHPNDLSSFDPLLGARDAIDRCVKMINFWVAKTPYEQGPKDLIEKDIFVISPSATASDNTV